MDGIEGPYESRVDHVVSHYVVLAREETAHTRSLKRETASFALLAVALRAFFWAYTGRTWEDALITAEHARNAAEGLGLTHHAGEGVVHGFTSAVSVLIPLIGEVLVSGSGLWLIRIVSLVAAVGTIYVAAAIAQELALRSPARLLLLGYLAVDMNHIFYGMAGMETQIAVLVLLWGVLLVVRRASPALIGLSLGVAILTRPDFILWSACVLLFALIQKREMLKTAGAMAGVIAPWVIFTTAYYGSPIPHTILAKSPVYGGITLYEDNLVAFFANHVPRAFVSIVKSFAPFYENTLVERAPIPLLVSVGIAALIWALASVGGWQLRNNPNWHPLLLFAGGFFLYRVGFIGHEYFDWYVPPHTASLMILATYGLDSISWSKVMAIGLVATFAITYPWMLGREAWIANNIEPVHQRLGAWLDDHVPIGDSVIGEPSGMLGYYSDVMLWDWPGLGSPTARLAVSESEDKGYIAMIDNLRADWLVLRSEELTALVSTFPGTAALYTKQAAFSYPPNPYNTDGFIVLQLVDS